MKNLTSKDDYIDWIYKRGNSGGKEHSLKKISKLLSYFDNPQDKIKVIHVAGTNGKGSTCRFLAQAIGEKYRCGLFTSPWMIRINESISINNQDISDHDFKKYIDILKPVVEKLDSEGYHNTYFEVLTAIMYMYFYDKKVDYAVVEVGMGGSLDSTNIIKNPIASVITTISKDHTKVLGNSLEKIAANKAGIIKKETPVFVYPQKNQVMDIIKDVADKKNSKLFTFKRDEIRIEKLSSSYNEFSFRKFSHMKTSLIGVHQIYNAALALMVLDYFKEDFGLGLDNIRKAFFQTRNLGRLEEIQTKPRVIVDGSHNKEAIDALINSLKNFSYDKLILGFSILKDKDYAYIIKKLASIADQVVVTSIDNSRLIGLDEIGKEFKKYGKNPFKIEDRRKAFKKSIELASENDLVLWCGSLYLVGDILKYKKEDLE